MKYLPKIPRLHFFGDAQPAGKASFVAVDRHDESAEPFLRLRDGLCARIPMVGTAVDAAPVASRKRSVIAILSPDAGDGRTYVALNLAAILAQDGVTTLLVDGDLRNPELSRSWARSKKDERPVPSLGTASLQVCSMLGVPGLHVSAVEASAGAGSPSPSIDMTMLSGLIDKSHGDFGFIVIDTPPAKLTTDALRIAEYCDFLVIVGRQGRSRMSDLHRLIDRAGRTKAQVSGVVLNAV